MEVELKLLLDPRDAAAFRDHAVLRRHACGAPVEQDQIDLYFDTPDLALMRSGAGLRVRRAGGAWIQTLKAGGSVVGGLHRRNEWESAVPGPEPDLYALQKRIDAPGPWQALIASPDFVHALAPVFATHVRRTRYDLRLADGTAIECVLDEGRLECGDRVEPISEVELELTAGDPLHLFDLALELLQDIPMRLGHDSKAARGYMLHTGHRAAAVKAEEPQLSKKMGLDQAFRAIVESCVRQVQGNEAGVVERDDAACLHQMRVGLRRLHSALHLFRRVVLPPDTLQQELAWLSEQVGAARDWDVLASSTLQTVGDAADPAELEALRHAASAKAADLHRAAAQAVASARYARFMLSFQRWLLGAAWRASLDAHDRQRLKAFSREMLERDRRRLCKRGRHLEEADAQGRHRVRIAAKKARYDLEFFQSLYPPKEAKATIKVLSALQDKLGWLNDLAVGDGLLAELQSVHEELADVAVHVRECLAASARDDKEKLRKLWKKARRRALTK